MNARSKTRRGAARLAAALAVPLVAAVALTGCSGGNDSLPEQWKDGGGKGYISGDGSSVSIPPEQRKAPVEYSGKTEDGSSFGSKQTLGHVTVVNFWYAGCAPCRVEAKDLNTAQQEFAPKGVEFVGVNTRDQAAQAQQFSEEFGVKYPSILDVEGDRGVQRAFASAIPLNATPVTLVLDAEGRVAHRVLGQLADAGQLRSMLNETLAEKTK